MQLNIQQSARITSYTDTGFYIIESNTRVCVPHEIENVPRMYESL